MYMYIFVYNIYEQSGVSYLEPIFQYLHSAYVECCAKLRSHEKHIINERGGVAFFLRFFNRIFADI